jgi:hypothetical protein
VTEAVSDLHTTAEPGFLGWVRHWSEGKDWFDAE